MAKKTRGPSIAQRVAETRLKFTGQVSLYQSTIVVMETYLVRGQTQSGLIRIPLTLQIDTTDQRWTAAWRCVTGRVLPDPELLSAVTYWLNDYGYDAARTYARVVIGLIVGSASQIMPEEELLEIYRVGMVEGILTE